MKINRNNTFVTAGIAALAVVGLALGATACLGNGTGEVTESRTEIASSTADTSDSDSTLTVVVGGTDDHEVRSADATPTGHVDPSTGAESSGSSTHSDELSTDDESPVIDTSTSETPATESPATDTEAVEDPTVVDPADDSAPEISTGTGSHPFGDVTAMPGATVEQVLFVGSNGNVDANIFAKESGFGGNDIVAVKLVYYVGGIKTSSSASLGITASTTRSLWNAESLNLTEGMSVSVRLTDENGRTTYHDVVVTFSTMG